MIIDYHNKSGKDPKLYKGSMWVPADYGGNNLRNKLQLEQENSESVEFHLFETLEDCSRPKVNYSSQAYSD